MDVSIQENAINGDDEWKGAIELENLAGFWTNSNLVMVSHIENCPSHNRGTSQSMFMLLSIFMIYFREINLISI